MQLTELTEKDLSKFTIKQFTEVFRINDVGVKSKSLGFFRDENIAKAFAENQTDASWHKTRNVLVLTDGKLGFLIGESITIADEESAIHEIKQKAMAKLSKSEKSILGI